MTAASAAQTGLAEGTPVVGGYFDVVASALGSGVVAPGAASIIAGTWSINQFVSSEPVVDRALLMVSAFGPDRYMNIDSSATSASHLEWYVRELVERGGHHDDPFGFCHQRLADIDPRLDDPYFHPFLYGSSRGASVPSRLLRAGELARRRPSPAVLVRRCRVRAPPAHRGAARRLARRSTRPPSPGAARAASCGRRCSPTVSACRSGSPKRRRPALSAPPSAQASA